MATARFERETKKRVSGDVAGKSYDFLKSRERVVDPSWPRSTRAWRRGMRRPRASSGSEQMQTASYDTRVRPRHVRRRAPRPAREERRPNKRGRGKKARPRHRERPRQSWGAARRPGATGDSTYHGGCVFSGCTGVVGVLGAAVPGAGSAAGSASPRVSRRRREYVAIAQLGREEGKKKRKKVSPPRIERGTSRSLKSLRRKKRMGLHSGALPTEL